MSGLGWVSDPAESRAPLVQGVFWTLLAVSTITVGLRLWIRWTLHRWQADDYCLILAWLSLLALVITMQLAIGLGLGKHSLDVPFQNIDPIANYGAATLSISIIGLAISKISFAVTLLNLTKDLWKWSNWLVWFVIVSLVMFSVPLSVLPWVQCKPLAKSFVDFLPGTCINKSIALNLGIFFASYSALVDFVFALMPWKMLWTLQMRSVEKFGVGIAMSLGAIAGVMAIMRASTVDNLTAQDMSYDGILAVLWGDIELSTTIIAACIPVLRKMIYDEFAGRSGSGSGSGGGSQPNQNCSDRAGQAKRSIFSNYHLSRLGGGGGKKKKRSGATTMPEEAAGIHQDNKSNDSSGSHRAKSETGGGFSGKWYAVYEREGNRQSDDSVMLQRRSSSQSSSSSNFEVGPAAAVRLNEVRNDERAEHEPAAPDMVYFGTEISVRYPVIRSVSHL